MKPTRLIFGTTIAGLLCGLTFLRAADATPRAGVGSSAVAVLVSGANSSVKGTVKFTQEAGGVRVHAELTGLAPGPHGFHVHEKGDLSAADLTSAGGHFNPATQPHAGPMAAMRHVGDLGNITAGADGKATLDVLDGQIQLAGAASIVGRAVIVHAMADDLATQPTGNAGARVAGGVIGVVEMK